MLNKATQKRLATHYGANLESALVKEAFDQNVAKGFTVEFDEEREDHAAVLFVDIAGFSHRVVNFTAKQLREYLDVYYGCVMPIIFNNGGLIDRVAGDGILAVFSSFFVRGLTGPRCERAALKAADQCIQLLSSSRFASKAAITAGDIMFCKTGVAEVYEECTVLGAPITRAYRIEEMAQENQVVMESTDTLRAIVAGQTVSPRGGEDSPPISWRLNYVARELRGVGMTNLIVQTWVGES